MNLKQVIAQGDVTQLAQLMNKYNLKLEGDRLVPADEKSKSFCQTEHEFYDRSQLIKKILLNSY